MSYWSLLEQAQRRLAAGELLDAERLLAQARDQRARSRLRAPVSEKAVEPMMRWARRLVRGESGESAAGPLFTQRADALESDLRAAAALRLQEASSRLAGRWEALTTEEVARVAQLLQLHCHGALFRIPDELLWPLLRAYLNGCGRHLIAPDPELAAVMGDVGVDGTLWLAGYAHGLLQESVLDLAPLAPWLIARLTRPGLPAAHPARWRAHALAARLSLLPMDGAPAALHWARAALSEAEPCDESRALLRLAAGLLCNESRVAVPAATEAQLLALHPLARRLEAPWPPDDLAALMRRRGADARGAQLAALTWDVDGSGRVALVRFLDGAPVDALLLELQEAGADERSALARGPVQARAEVDAWLAPGTPVLCEGDPPPTVASLVADRPLVHVGLLEQALPAGPDPPVELPAPRGAHPALSAPGDPATVAWQPLLAQARFAAPRLRARATSAAIASTWGRGNVRALADAGLDRLAGLAQALALLAPPAPPTETQALQRVPTAVVLRWPLLHARAWPTEPGAVIAVPSGAPLPAGDLLVQGRVEPAALAAWAVAGAPAAVVAADIDRARAVAAHVASRGLGGAVTVVPDVECCAEPFLQLLDRWIDESVAAPERALDVLWLYHALATAPEGDVGRWLPADARPHARGELQAALARAQRGCSESCRLRYEGGCFSAQLQQRVAGGRVWIRVQSADGAPRQTALLLVDDPTRWIAQLEDAQAQEAWDGLERWVRSAARWAVCADAGPLGEALGEALSAALPASRTLRLHALAGGRPQPALYVVAAGYEPGSLLLGDESAALARLRANAWLQRTRGVRLWLPPGEEAREWGEGDRHPPLSGVGVEASAEVVVVPRVAAEAARGRGVALLRLAMAASHARQLVACLDPRVAAMEGIPRRGVLPPGVTDPLEGTQAADLLDRTVARRLPRWRRPLDAQRLSTTWERVLGMPPRDPGRTEALAAAAGELVRGARVAVGATQDPERVLLAALLAQLAAEARDGGPLRVRAVLWLDDHMPPLEHQQGIVTRALGSQALAPASIGRLQDALLAAETGALHLLAIPPGMASLPLVREWAARATEVAWVLPDADRARRGHPAFDPQREAALAALGSLPAEQGPLVLALLDAEDARPGSELHAVAQVLGATTRVVERRVPVHEGWRLVREPLPDPDWSCRACGRPGKARHSYDLCRDCGASLLLGVHDEDQARRALLIEAARWLARRSSTRAVVAVAPTAQERDELQSLLGVDAAALADTPLLSGHGASGPVFSVHVMALADLWTGPIPEGELVLSSLPSHPEQLRSALDRLAACGRDEGTLLLLDHPLGWPAAAQRDADRIPTGARAPALWRWSVGRPQVEARIDEALDAVERGMRGRPQALGAPQTLRPAETALAAAWAGPLLMAVEGWTPARLRRPAQSLEADAARERITRARKRALAVLDRAVAEGLRFDGVAPAIVQLDRIEPESAFAHATLAFLRWLQDEGLLQRADANSQQPGKVAGVAPDGELHWFVDVHRIAPGQSAAVPAWPAPRAGAAAPAAVRLLPSRGAWVLGAPGAGKTSQLLQLAREGDGRGARPLLLVPGGIALLRCVELAGDDAERLEIATGEELALAFLRAHHGSFGFAAPPRLLPEAGGADGEAVRKRLLMETCRRYALAAGRAPSLDLVELRRIVEGAPAEMAAAGDADGALDVPLLRRCAAQAREAAGWIHRDELCSLTRRWLSEQSHVAQAWRDRYPRVLVDDVHAFDPQELDLIEQLFPVAERWSAADPALLPAGHSQRGAKGLTQSHRLSREIARAASAILVRELRVSGAVQSAHRAKGRITRRRGFNLQACYTAIEELLGSLEKGDRRIGIVARSNEDLAWLAARLREKQLAVWSAADVARRAAPGPRELLAALRLCDGGQRLPSDERAGLAALLLRSAGERVPEVDLAEIDAFLLAALEGAECAPASRGEAYLLQLAAVARELDRVELLSEAAQLLLRTRLLSRAAARDAVAGRLHDFVDEQRERAWRSCAREIDPAALLEPLGPGPRIWLLLPSQLAGAEYDDVIHLCTGHEALELHYRVVARAGESLAVLYSEIDPLETFA